MNVDELKKRSLFVRRDILELIIKSGKGHIGGAFSSADILTALYYGDILRFKAGDPDWNGRDRFILSKGHSCVALYVILSDLGFFPSSELESQCHKGSILGGHPDRKIPGVEANTGSLGHGLGIGAGLALSAKMSRKDFMTVVLMGDGECYEGSVWEAALFSSHHSLDNLVVIIDRNCQCATDFTEECVRLNPLELKWQSFGWDTVRIDGHLFPQICSAFKDFRNRATNKPLAIIADTIKGKGVSFMERKLKWHHGIPNEDEAEIARRELSFSK